MPFEPNLSKVIQVEKENLKNSSAFIKYLLSIAFVIMSFPKETPGLDYFTVEFYQIFKL